MAAEKKKVGKANEYRKKTEGSAQEAGQTRGRNKTTQDGVRKTRKPRAETRHLMRWTDDSNIELLLQIFAVSRHQNIQLPLDKVGAEMRTKSGAPIMGNAITQHIAKLRANRIKKGLPVPRITGGVVSGSGSGTSGSSNANKSRSSRSAITAVYTECQDDEADYDVDDAADPDGPFDEPRSTNRSGWLASKKGSATHDDSDDEDEVQNIKAKGRSAAKSNKRKQVTKEKSPDMPNVTSKERSKRRTSVDYAKLNGVDTDSEDEYDPNEAYVAAGASFLKLSKAEHHNSSDEESEDENIVKDDDIEEDDMSEDGGEQPSGKPSKIIVLRLGPDKASATMAPKGNNTAMIGGGAKSTITAHSQTPSLYEAVGNRLNHNMTGLRANVLQGSQYIPTQYTGQNAHGSGSGFESQNTYSRSEPGPVFDPSRPSDYYATFGNDNSAGSFASYPTPANRQHGSGSGRYQIASDAGQHSSGNGTGYTSQPSGMSTSFNGFGDLFEFQNAWSGEPGNLGGQYGHSHDLSGPTATISPAVLQQNPGPTANQHSILTTFPALPDFANGDSSASTTTSLDPVIVWGREWDDILPSDFEQQMLDWPPPFPE